MISDQTENPRHRLMASVTYTHMVELSTDNFISATNNLSLSYLTHFLREMLHVVHYISPLPTVTKHQGQDPILQNKTRTEIGNMGHNEGNIGDVYRWIKFQSIAYSRQMKKCHALSRKFAN